MRVLLRRGRRTEDAVVLGEDAAAVGLDRGVVETEAAVLDGAICYESGNKWNQLMGKQEESKVEQK